MERRSLVIAGCAWTLGLAFLAFAIHREVRVENGFAFGYSLIVASSLSVVAALLAGLTNRILARLGVPTADPIHFGDGAAVAVLAVATFIVLIFVFDLGPNGHWVLTPALSLVVLVRLYGCGRLTLVQGVWFATIVTWAFLLATMIAVEVTKFVPGEAQPMLAGAAGGASGALLSLTGLWPLGGTFRRPAFVLSVTTALGVVGALAFWATVEPDHFGLRFIEKVFPFALYVPWQALFLAAIFFALSHGARRPHASMG